MMQPGITVKNLLAEFGFHLSGIYSSRETRQLFNMLCKEHLGWNTPEVHLSMDQVLNEPVLFAIRRELVELMTGRPIQYILGKASFNDLEFKVNEQVLIPRPETEELCVMIKSDRNLKLLKAPLLLDICTGSGCIAVYLKKHLPDAAVVGIDNSLPALEVASDNAHNNQCEVEFLFSDILDEKGWNKFEAYDVIVSNPPYVLQLERTVMKRNVTEFEPEQALFVADENPLLYYKAIVKFATMHLRQPGYLWFEINERFGAEVSALAREAGFAEANILQDLQGRDRFIQAVMKPANP